MRFRCANCSEFGHRITTCKKPISTTKYCSKCDMRKDKSYFGFVKKTTDHLSIWCKECCNKSASISRKLPTQKKSRAEKEYKLKYDAIAAYGNECECCGESKLAFLNIDHALNDGAKYRMKNLSGRHLYLWLLKQGYPKDLGLRVMCWNCNCGRMVNGGTCPHLESGPS